MKIKIIDLYIIRKFLTTFIYSIALIILIVVVFDVAEKMDDFIEGQMPLSEIIIDYYLNFIPYFINLFSPLFIFISVVFFTSRMAQNTEIVAIFNGGISFMRFIRPYLIAAALLALLSFYLANRVIPRANYRKLEFEEKYVRSQFVLKARNIHRQIAPGQFIYFESYNARLNQGYRFSLEKIENGKLTYKLISETIQWDSVENKWTLENYFIREIKGMDETIKKGMRMDTLFSFSPEEFNRRILYISAMDKSELKEHIKKEKLRGSENLYYAQVEKEKRVAYPFASFILTAIGVSFSSRKIRGGMGKFLALGVLLSFTYILFMQISSTFALTGNIPAVAAVWLPNIVFSLLAAYLLKQAQK